MKEGNKNANNLVERLRIGISLAGQPALRNQIIDAQLIAAVANLMRSFMSVFAMKGDSSIIKTLSLVQVAVSTILEAVAQIHLQGVDDTLLQTLMNDLIPSICAMSSHTDKDVRILLAVSLRQLGIIIIIIIIIINIITMIIMIIIIIIIIMIIIIII